MALRGGSSNHASHFRRLADALPTLLRRRTRSKTTRTRQVQRRLTLRQAKKLVAEYEAGDSMLQLAKRWGLHRTTISEHLRRAGVAVRERGIPAERLDEAIRLYAEGWSLMRLGDHFGCNGETVRQALLAAGLAMRPKWHRRGH